jgi:hypothetical protein
MVDDRPEDTGPPDAGRARREPPTIDLEATEVSTETQAAAAGVEPEPKPEPEPEAPRASKGTMAAAIIAAFSGASAAALVLGAAWFAGWPLAASPPPAPQVNSLISSAAVDDLAARLASIESKVARPAAATPDPAAASRAEALEKSLAALRGELATQRAQSDKLASAINDAKSAPAAPPPDLSAITERMAQIERAARAQNAELSKEIAKPADDVPLRRIVAAALLDVLVRTGDPYPAAIDAAKALAPNPDALKPLEGFAASGVPNANSLSRELLTLVPKLSPPSPDTSTTGTGIVDRLQAGAAKLVRIERSDAVGSDRGAVVARVTAAALRNDFAEARRELKTLPPADRAAAQAWLDKADARDAALAASRQFATEAMATLAKPAQ